LTGIPLACPCGEVYELKPEYAGRLVACPHCGRHLRAGRAPAGTRVADPTAPAVDPAFDRDVFLLRERVFSITTRYEVGSEDGTPILYVERPTFLFRTLFAYLIGAVAGLTVFSWVAAETSSEAAGMFLTLLGYALGVTTFVAVMMSIRPRRHVTVYRDDSCREIVMRILQDQRIAMLVRTYTITTPDGAALARLRKNYLYNAIRKRWDIETPAGALVAYAVEESIVLSLLRRVMGPLFGLLRTNFVFERADGEELGEFNRKFTLFDRYVLDLSEDPDRTLDRRFALATGIMLDTGERR
jgi:uncharacterized protein YxjI